MMVAAPTFLWALALLVPVLLCFLVRKNRQILRVPSTMVWRLGARSVAKSKRFRNIRRLLALLACLGGVGALVFGAARPSGKRADRIAFVVDVSASMSGTPLAEARGWLKREAAALGSEARVAIVLAGSEVRVALPPSPPGARVDEAIDAISVEKGDAAIDEAIVLAESLAVNGKEGPRGRVVVLTDQPVSADASRAERKPEMRVFGRKATATDNVGITSMFTRTAPDAHDEDEREATIAIATSSSTPRRVRLVIKHADRVLAERRIDLRGEHTEHVGLRGAGRLVATIEPIDGKGDALAIDNQASLDEVTRRTPRVALFRRPNMESSAAFFIEKAIRAAGVTELEQVDPDGTDPKGMDVAVVLDDGRARTPDVPAFLIGVAPPEIALTTTLVVKSNAHVRSLALDEPLLRGVSLDGLTTVRAQAATHLPRNARALVELDAGPVLVAGGSDRQAWVWLGIDPEASDLVLRVAFPVLVSNVLAHLGGSSQVVVAKTVPLSEVAFFASGSGAPLPEAPSPRWRVPATPAVVLAALAALLLALEAYLTFRLRWTT